MSQDHKRVIGACFEQEVECLVVAEVGKGDQGPNLSPNDKLRPVMKQRDLHRPDGQRKGKPEQRHARPAVEYNSGAARATERTELGVV